jgi:hypothetical protein
MHPLGLDNLDFEAYRGTGGSFLRIKKLREETLVLSYFATGWYEIRRFRSPARQRAIPAAAPISESEFEELGGLRMAQGWGTPMFQPGHPKCQQALARLAELEAKERAASDFGPLRRVDKNVRAPSFLGMFVRLNRY